MQLRDGIQTLDAYRPTFDPNLDIATVVFSHVQCVRTRLNLALVSKLWRDSSKPAAAYPLEFDVDAFPDVYTWTQGGTWTKGTRVIHLMDNDEALSLPYERVVGLLGEAAEHVCNYSAMLGSVRLLKWARVNNRDWSTHTCTAAAENGHLPALQYLHENGCPWDPSTCYHTAYNGHLPALKYLHENGCPWNSNSCLNAALNGHMSALKYLHENGCPWDFITCHNASRYRSWDCLQYAVDNKCPGWKKYAKKHAEHLR